MDVTPPPRRLFSLEEVMALLAGTSRANLVRIVRRGDLKTVAIGRRKYVTAAEYDRYLTALEESAALEAQSPAEVDLQDLQAPLQRAKGRRKAKTSAAIERKRAGGS
jgi:hypothetical protein